MKRLVAAVAALMLPVLANALPVWDFSGGKTGPWTRTSQLTATPTSEGLRLELTGRDSHIATTGLNLNPRECGGIAIEYRAEGFKSPTTGQLFFVTKASPRYDSLKKIELPPLVCDGAWHTIVLDADDVRGGRRLWVNGGRIAGLRLDFCRLKEA